MDKLEIDTRRGTISLNGVELNNVTEIGIRLNDDDRTTVTVTLSPCEVEDHVEINDGHNDWIGGVMRFGI